MLKIAYSPIYKYKLPDGHRFPMMKYELLPEQLLYEGTVNEDSFFHPEALTEKLILDTHDTEYWQKLKDQTLSVKEIRKIGFPLSPELVTRGTHISQGTIDCALFAMQDGVALNIAGGTHHAYADHGEGFCLLNDIAIASNYLIKENLASQILVVDLDVHQGNGTAKLFEGRPEVFTFSMHGAKNYPNRKEKSDLDIGLPDKTEDALFLNTLENTLPKLIDEVQPDFVFYLSGVDVLATDKLGRLSMSIDGAKARDRFVFESCRKNNIPVAVSMGGGYSERLADIVEAHANTFREAMYQYF